MQACSVVHSRYRVHSSESAAMYCSGEPAAPPAPEEPPLAAPTDRPLGHRKEMTVSKRAPPGQSSPFVYRRKTCSPPTTRLALAAPYDGCPPPPHAPADPEHDDAGPH